MKKISFFIIAVFIICTAFNKTTTILQSDYRDSYTGTYSCEKSSTSRNSDGSPQIKKSTLTINISKDVVDSVLQITIGSNIHKFKLRNSTLIEYPNEGRKSGKFFATDSVNLHISYGFGGASRLIGKKT